LYLSPDLRFLAPALYDTELDPVEAEQVQRRELLAGLTGGHSPQIGSRTAEVTLTVLSDFQCPFCRKEAQVVMDEIRTTHNGTIRLLFRHLPLKSHPWAELAAEASACAEQEGDEAFWTAHDFLFANQTRISLANLTGLLEGELKGAPGLDLNRYRKCLQNGDSKAIINKDVAFALRHGISSTPTLFVDDYKIEGAVQPEQLRTIIKEVLTRKRRSE
jgi:protein-disulfide isomerase